MSLISLPVAKAHLRLESDYPDDQVQGKLDAAIVAASQFINRRVYETDELRQAAIDAVPADLDAADVAFVAAREAADLLASDVARYMATEQACSVYRAALVRARETYAAIIPADDAWKLFEAGVLLILGHLFENRQDVVTGTTVAHMPNGSAYVLQPLRTGLGV